MEPNFNIFQKVIETVLLFKDRKVTANDKILKEIINPLFEELTIIVENYFEIFYTAKKLILEHSGNDFIPSLNEITKLREQNLVARIKTRELISILSTEYKNKYLLDFSNKTEKFFYSSRWSSGKRMSMPYELIFEIFEQTKDSEIDKDTLLRYIDSNLKKMEDNWTSIVQSYARIKIKLIKAKIYEDIIK